MSITQDDSAATTTAAQGKPTPNEYIVQCAHTWNGSRKRMISSTGAEKNSARDMHRPNEMKLADACDLAVKAQAKLGAQP